MHISTKHFVAAVAPTPVKPLQKKIRKLLDDACRSGDLNQGDVSAVLAALESNEEEDEAPGADGADCYIRAKSYSTSADYSAASRRSALGDLTAEAPDKSLVRDAQECYEVF